MSRTDTHPRRKEQIIDAAAVVFARHGLQQTRMDDIVKEAGISKGSIYWYFESKDAVIEALMERMFSPEFAWLRTMVQQDDLSVYERLMAFTERSLMLVQHVQQQGLLPLFVDYIALATHDAQARQVFQTYNQTARDLLVPLFAYAVECGEFRPVDPDCAYLSYAALVDGLLIGEYCYDHHLPLPQRIRASVQLLLDGLRTPTGVR